MRILITGGIGFIGCNISLLARKKGYDVVAFDSLIRPGTEGNIKHLIKAGAEFVRGDIRNPEDFQRIGKVDAIIHLAGNPGIPWSIKWPVYDYNVNATGTLNVLEYSRLNGKVPVIFASTNKTYSDLINVVPLAKKKTRYEWEATEIEGFHSLYGLSEHFPTEGFGIYPHSPYGVSKLAADHYCQEYFHVYGIPTVINRMSCIYGYYQQGVEDQGWIDWFVRALTTGDRKINIYGDGKQVRDMLWGEDVAEVYLKELERIDDVKGEVFNLGGGYQNTLSLKEAINEIEEQTGNRAEITYADWRHADQRIYISDIRKIEGILNWKPKTSPQEGIRLMIEAYKEGKYDR